MNKKLRIAFLVIAGIIFLLLIVFSISRLTRQVETFDIQKIPTCADVAIGLTSSRNTVDKTTDLDPSIPMDSKASYIIRHVNDTNEVIFYSTNVQVSDYLRTINDHFCILAGFPPTCTMGHQPPRVVNGTPQTIHSSAPTCTVPTSSVPTSKQ